MTNLSEASIQDLTSMLELLDKLRGTSDPARIEEWTAMVRSEATRRFSAMADGAAILEAARAARGQT